MSDQIVKLNVGGVFYDTSLQTLSVEGSYFAALFSGNWDEGKDENGRIFIDRDGRAFEYVLDFMRNGSRMVLPESAEMRNRVGREADFYILPDLAELLKTDSVKLDVGGIHYTCSIETLSKSPYFTNLLSGDLSSKKDENGRIFIDRDGRAFEYVLDFMRNGSRMVLPESAEMRNRVGREADFYILPDLAELLKTDSVKLDVGGIHYTCSIETLSKSPYFTNLLSGDLSSKKDENGRIFIDRDGRAFEYVLDFLRNGSRMVLPESAEMRNRVGREADFYLLPDLAELLKTDSVKLDVGGIHYTCSIETLSKSPYFTNLLSGDLNSKKDENGRIFIDRDGRAFEYVLDFLRNGSKMVLPESVEMRDRVGQEAQFYELPDLKYLVKESMTLYLKIQNRQNEEEYALVHVNLGRLKMYPGNWFETAKKELVWKTKNLVESGFCLLNRGKNYIASAVVAEYVGSSDRLRIYYLDENEFHVKENILDAVAFFGLPQALGYEIITHWKKIKHIPE